MDLAHCEEPLDCKFFKKTRIFYFLKKSSPLDLAHFEEPLD